MVIANTAPFVVVFVVVFAVVVVIIVVVVDPTNLHLKFGLNWQSDMVASPVKLKSVIHFYLLHRKDC